MSFLFLLFPCFPHMVQPNGGGHQQDADGHDSGNGGSVHALIGEQLHFSLNSVIHGVINTSTGQQGEYGDDQIGDGREFPDSGHDLGISWIIW